MLPGGLSRRRRRLTPTQEAAAAVARAAGRAGALAAEPGAPPRETPLRPTPDATALLPAGHLLAACLVALPLPPLLWWGGAPLEALLVGGLGRLAMLVGLWYALRGP